MRRQTRALNTEETSEFGQLQPGVTLQDRYLILGVLGTGGMGSVYKGRDLHFPNVTKLVAVKEMINMATDPTMHEMVVRNFEREADLLATLSHPSIPRIYDYFTHDRSSYLVMEFIEGRDLEAILREAENFLPEEQVVAWAIELCDVLTFLHGHKPQPVVFRDMKPSNVMVDQHGHIRLIDFGIARVFQPGEKGTMIGTEGYSPPEQYRGEASPAGDLYALGATLHHLLTRRDPRSEPPFSFAERPIREINPAVSAEVEGVIDGALAYDPKERYQGADGFKSALLVAAKKTGILSSRQTSAALQPRNEVEALWQFECEDEIRGTPVVWEGKVYVGCYDNNVYCLNADDGEFLWKYATEGGIAATPVIDDGVLYVASEDHRLYALTAEGGRLLWTYYAEGPLRSTPTSFEGHIFFGSDDHYLHVVNASSGRRAWRVEAADAIRCQPLVAEERVYLGCESGDFYCVDFRGEIKWRFRAKRAITSSPILVEKMLYFGSMDWTLYAIEAEGGWQVWRFRLGGPTIATPVFHDGRLFTGSADGNIYALEARTSREAWRFETEHQVNSSPIIHEDSLYCGSVDGSLYCLDVRSGRKRWKFTTGNAITGSAVVAQNILYFGSTDHRVYAMLT
ncbi:MAG TPA: serine/threonine-protein kinase [Anaerolineales bacterium]|jgi:outer membrane protein assembly factor BamB/tRNA A-37 threonylcarbamoyl transferase component Bud32